MYLVFKVRTCVGHLVVVEGMIHPSRQPRDYIWLCFFHISECRCSPQSLGPFCWESDSGFGAAFSSEYIETGWHNWRCIVQWLQPILWPIPVQMSSFFVLLPVFFNWIFLKSISMKDAVSKMPFATGIKVCRSSFEMKLVIIAASNKVLFSLMGNSGFYVKK